PWPGSCRRSKAAVPPPARRVPSKPANAETRRPPCPPGTPRETPALWPRAASSWSPSWRPRRTRPRPTPARRARETRPGRRPVPARTGASPTETPASFQRGPRLRWTARRAVPAGTPSAPALEHSGYLQELHDERSIEAEARVENLREFLSVTRQFEQEQGGGLGEFLEHVALVSDVDAYDADANSVTMMTLHA